MSFSEDTIKTLGGFTYPEMVKLIVRLRKRIGEPRCVMLIGLKDLRDVWRATTKQGERDDKR